MYKIHYLLCILIITVSCNNNPDIKIKVPGSNSTSNSISDCTGPLSGNPETYDDIMDRIYAMRIQKPDRGCINLRNADLTLVWGDAALEDRIFVKYLGYASADDFAINDPDEGGFADYNDLLTTYGYANTIEFDIDYMWMDPYMPGALSWDNVDVTGAIFPAMNFNSVTSERGDFFKNVKGVDSDVFINSQSLIYGEFWAFVWPQIDVSAIDFTGVSLSSNDFSQTTGLTTTQLNSASGIEGIVLPDNFDLTGFDPTGKNVKNIDFSNTTGLTATMLNAASDLQYLILPSGFDATGLNTAGKNLTGLDFSNTTGLTLAMVEAALGMRFIKFPTGFDFTGWDTTGQNLSDADFSGTVGLTIAMLNTASTIPRITLPDGFDVTGLDMVYVPMSGRSVEDINFSKVIGLTTAMIGPFSIYTNGSYYTAPYEYISLKFPDAFDLSTLNATGKSLNNLDLSNTVGITTTILNDSSGYSAVKYPSGFDFTGANNKLTINASDLTGTVGLTATIFNNSSGATIRGTTFPDGIDLTGFDFTGRRIHFIDFSNTTGLTLAILNTAIEFKGLNFPVGFDISSLPVTADLNQLDLSNTVGLTVSHLNNASSGQEITLPEMDMTNFSITNSGARSIWDVWTQDWNLSNVTDGFDFR